MAMKYAGTVFLKDYSMTKLNICSIPLSVGLENDIL